MDLDVLPEEVPTRSSKRLAGEEAEKVDLPTPGARAARVARVSTGTVFIGRSDRYEPKVFVKQPHPKPTLPQKYTMDFQEAKIELN